MKKILTIFLPLLMILSGYSQTISTFVGNGKIGQIPYTGQGATSINCFPLGLAVDTFLDLFYLDQVTNTLGKITSGTFSYYAGTFAGSGQPQQGYAGDGQLARYAKFNNPYGVATDDSGNVYICDQFNFRLRKIFKTSGVIVTIAGTGTRGNTGDNGLALSATLGGPYSVTVDKNFHIYLNDKGNNRVRLIRNDSIFAFAGSGTVGFLGDNGPATAARFDGIEQIASDDSLNVYIVDRNNQRVRKVYNNDTIVTIAGNGTAGFLGDGGAATSARLNYPTGVCVDDSLNVFIADQRNNRIRRVNKSNAVISTYAGTGLAKNTGDGGLPSVAAVNSPYNLAVDKAYAIYIATTGYRIRKITR